MWINLALYGFLAIGLFPDSVFSQEQDLCETCTGDDCTVKIHNVDRRFYKYNGDLYYFETDKEKYSWLEGHARCTTMFLGYSVQPTNLVSFHTKQEFDFIKGKLMSLSIRRAFFGGRRSNDNIYDWVWTDGSAMNKNLIPSLRPKEARNEESLWNGPQPDNWYERENVMEIKNYGFHQLNDVPETYRDGSFVCKISCTKSTCNQPELPKECSPGGYSILNEEGRSNLRKTCTIDNHGNSLGGCYSDWKGDYLTKSKSWEGEDWYRMENPAGTKIPETKQEYGHCGAIAPGWMDDTHPLVAYQTKTVKFCFNRQCSSSLMGKVTNCNGFSVYYLPEPQAKGVRYCAKS